MDDATAFAVALVSFWIGMGAYLLWLHRLVERLQTEVARAVTTRHEPHEPSRRSQE